VPAPPSSQFRLSQEQVSPVQPQVTEKQLAAELFMHSQKPPVAPPGESAKDTHWFPPSAGLNAQWYPQRQSKSN
jgi:hypothetical protein